MQMIYLDNNATTMPTLEVAAVIDEVNQSLWANPSSVHRFGQTVRHRIELARQQVASLINARPNEIIFTSGGTESNNLALRGTLESSSHNRTLITTATEHAAITQPAERLQQASVNLVHVTVNRDGQIDLNDLQANIEQQAAEQADITVSIQWASNETGVIQPIEAIGRIIAQAREQYPGTSIVFHSDATQAVGKIPVDITSSKVDLLTCAAHKFHGPKGIGALFLRTGVRLHPQQTGGPQERQRRGGTENTSGIIAMGLAAEQAATFLCDSSACQQLAIQRDTLEDQILQRLPFAVVNPPLTSPDSPAAQLSRLPNTTNIGFPRLHSEAILLGLSERGLCASAGAACSSGSVEPSSVLLAMQVPENVALGSIRFSLSRFTTDREIEQAVDIVDQVVSRLQKTLPTT